MRFPIIAGALLVAAAIRPDMQFGWLLSGVLMLWLAKAIEPTLRNIDPWAIEINAVNVRMLDAAD